LLIAAAIVVSILILSGVGSEIWSRASRWHYRQHHTPDDTVRAILEAAVREPLNAFEIHQERHIPFQIVNAAIQDLVARQFLEIHVCRRPWSSAKTVLGYFREYISDGDEAFLPWHQAYRLTEEGWNRLTMLRLSPPTFV